MRLTAIRFGIVTLLLAAGFQCQARANYVTNPTFSTGSTLPFSLSVDAGATAGPPAGDGGLTVSTFNYSAIGGGVVNAAVFQAGTTGGTSGSPVGGSLSQVLTLANASQFTYSVDFAMTSTVSEPTAPIFQILVNGAVVDQTTPGNFDAGAIYEFPLTDTFTTSGLAGGSQSVTIAVRIADALPGNVGFTEYVSNISVTNYVNSGGGGGNPPSVPEPASMGMLALGLGLAGLVMAGRSRIAS
jgi:hypothetical protein